MDLGEKNNPITELRKAEVKLKNGDAIYLDTVSYTHLTLPTILLV